ncbi:hypothetical protein Thermus77359_14690 [Thermus oshimai]|jgi:hypothetical protein|uniref:hypothetical protein n=1 Tax=Thermus sp. TaxID=275 RepID=UPI00309C544F
MELGILTEHTSGLSERTAEELGLFLWNPAQEGLEAALARLLPLYDRVLLLLSRPPFGAHLPLGQALARKYPHRLLLHATPLFGPGLAALAERAAEEAGRREPKEVLAELLRVEREGQLFLAIQDGEKLRALGWLPPGGGLVLSLGFFALFALEGEALRQPPLPVPKGQLPSALARFWGGRLGGRKGRIRLLLGESLWEERKAFQEALHGLKPERGVFGPLPRVWEEALGSRALLGFAYPL